MKYNVTIGIEIHCELKTRTKMFSSAPVSFGKDANTCTSAIDLAFPGTLPCLNKEAVRLAIKACSALHCEIDSLVRFDRKNYYYSDLPKGYQITQQFHPIGKNGYVTIQDNKKIHIERIHMEEDTAKQFHKESGTYIDFNRAGTPLIEIVSYPEMHTAKEAAAYVQTLREILSYLNISDGKMEEGSMRCDINVSLSNDDTLGTKVEIKNLNSIHNVQKAVQAEIERQSQLLNSGYKVQQATCRYDETKKKTIVMRKKEKTIDYKYFPEPNIFPIQLDEEWIQNIQTNLEELPAQRVQRFIQIYNLKEKDANLLINDKSIADFFEEVCTYTSHFNRVANWILQDLKAYLNKYDLYFEHLQLNPSYFAKLVDLIESQTISSKQAKMIFEDVLQNKNPQEIIELKGLKQVNDNDTMLEIVQSVLDLNPQSIQDYKNGKDRALGFLVGQVMKASCGQANPKLANKLIQEELKKR